MKFPAFCALVIIFLLLVSGCSSPPPQSSTNIENNLPLPSTPTITTPLMTSQPSTGTPSSGEMTVSFIDVGQGDSELIQFPSGKTMLIDAGPTDAGSTVSNYLRSRGISTIDMVVATHPHEDHIGGMSTVLNGFTVKQFVDSGYPHTTSTYENMLILIDKKNIPFRTVAKGDTISLDPSVSITVLNPPLLFSDEINENSVVLKIVYGKVTFLFMGDASSITDHADILKVPHHGSNTGASSLLQIDPAVSIIEVGAGNSYGHPTATTLQRLQQTGSGIYRTDRDGTIIVTSNGETYSASQTKTAGTTSTTVIPIIAKAQYTTVTTTTVSGTTSCDCSSNRYNCADFASKTKAQSCYDYCINQGKGDVHGLDGDNDGLACESGTSGSSSTTYKTTSSSGSGSCPAGKCWVNGYYRKSGTYVKGYCRSC